MYNSSSDFINLAKHPVKFRMFLFFNLPAAFLAGIKIRDIDPDQCAVSIKYRWLNKNPFRSTYFASLSMAAELSTGALAMMNIYKRYPKCSMLLLKTNGTFAKKAIGTTTFTCLNGREITTCIENAYLTNQPQSIQVISEGKNASNEVVATFSFLWSFKVKK